MVVGTTIVPEAARFLLPLLIALKLRDEKLYKKIIGGECNATEIIEHLVSKHNAWELFSIDFETKEYVGVRFERDMSAELYAISPYSWRILVSKVLRQERDKLTDLSEKLFHPVVQKIHHMKKSLTQYFISDFGWFLDVGIPINNFSKCIELVEFKDETQRH